MKTFRLPLIAALALSATAALGQGTEVALGGLKHDTSLPVEVTSDTLSVADESGQAVFDGNVIVIQGPMRLAAAKIDVFYSQAEDGSSRKIQKMVATGGVTYVNGADAAESKEAVYSPDSGDLVMTGAVLLTQGASVMSGERLTVDLDAGTGVMEGRVRTTFQTGDK